MNIFSKSPVKESSFSGVIIKADGTRIDLGEIAYYHKNPLKVVLWKIKKVLKKLIV